MTSSTFFEQKKIVNNITLPNIWWIPCVTLTHTAAAHKGQGPPSPCFFFSGQTKRHSGSDYCCVLFVVLQLLLFGTASCRLQSQCNNPLLISLLKFSNKMCCVHSLGLVTQLRSALLQRSAADVIHQLCCALQSLASPCPPH